MFTILYLNITFIFMDLFCSYSDNCCWNECINGTIQYVSLRRRKEISKFNFLRTDENKFANI